MNIKVAAFTVSEKSSNTINLIPIVLLLLVHCLFLLHSFVGISCLVLVLLCCTHSVLSSFAINSLRKRDLVVLLLLSS